MEGFTEVVQNSKIPLRTNLEKGNLIKVCFPNPSASGSVDLHSIHCRMPSDLARRPFDATSLWLANVGSYRGVGSASGRRYCAVEGYGGVGRRGRVSSLHVPQRRQR